MKSLGYSKCCNSSSNIVLEESGVKIFSSCNVAQTFNRFYTSVAANLVDKLPVSYGMFTTSCSLFKDLYFRCLGNRPDFVLSPVTSHSIRKQLLALNPKKAVGLDDVSSLFLRDGADLIVSPITHTVNLSIITEIVPQGLKEAKVLPLFKKKKKGRNLTRATIGQ